MKRYVAMVMTVVLMLTLTATGSCEGGGIDQSIVEVLKKIKCPYWPKQSEWLNEVLGEEINLNDIDHYYYRPGEAPEGASLVYYSRYVDFERIREANFTLVESKIEGENIYELYKGHEGGYLALAREGEKVYCVQYVNEGDSQKYYEEERLQPDIYTHYSNTPSCSFYLGSESAFFMDGSRVAFGYSSPKDEEPCEKSIDYEYNILLKLDSYSGVERKEKKYKWIYRN